MDWIGSNELVIKQRKELGELFGYEARNKYEITSAGESVGFAAEQGKGLGAILLRQFLGHWRVFEIHFFDKSRSLLFRAVHPFRFFFARLEVVDNHGTHLGAIQQRFAIFSKRFDVVSSSGEKLSVNSPFWRPWTFEFKNKGQTRAMVQKKWSGLIKEAFTDAENFRVVYSDAALSTTLRTLILAAAVFVDLQYFERKA